MSEKAPERKEIPEKSDQKVNSPSTDMPEEKRIIILRERDIPFEEERPPNFSPHYSVTVHQIRRKTKQEEQKE